jgi:cyclase
VNDMTATLRILEPYPGLYAYYDGRVEGRRLHSAGPNWLDDGAYELGIASYAIVDAGDAVVYDTHISLDHARAIRGHLAGLGVTRIRVVLSHWHNDHVAGNEVFSDCEIIALTLTDKALRDHQAELAERPPPISPLILPNRLFDGRLNLDVGGCAIELLHFDIHSADGAVIWLPDDGILLAGDTLEDTVTYISEPQHVTTHIAELARLKTLPIHRILPSHGAPERIAAGGYGIGLIDANRRYLERLVVAVDAGSAAATTLADFVAEDTASGDIFYFAPYEAVNARNVERLRRARGHSAPAA